MQSRYQFREITKSEVPQMFSMILKRMEWMDEKGIQQWNAEKYDKIYPLSFQDSDPSLPVICASMAFPRRL